MEYVLTSRLPYTGEDKKEPNWTANASGQVVGIYGYLETNREQVVWTSKLILRNALVQWSAA